MYTSLCMARYNRISGIYVCLDFTFFFSFPSLSPAPYATSTSTSGASRKTSIFFRLLTNHLLNASRVKEGCRTTKSSLSIGIIFKGISTVFIYFLCHIFIPLILELASDSFRLQSINDKKSGTSSI